MIQNVQSLSRFLEKNRRKITLKEKEEKALRLLELCRGEENLENSEEWTPNSLPPKKRRKRKHRDSLVEMPNNIFQ